MATITFNDCIIRKTIPGSNHCAWNTNESRDWSGPIYEYTFYLAKSKIGEQYYLFFTYDRYERGQWEQTEEEGCIPITPQLANLIAGEGTPTTDVIKVEGLIESFEGVAVAIEEKLRDSIYYQDIRNDLSELNLCLKNKCYRATLALSGRLLEMSLKHYLVVRGESPEKDWMVGSLLKKIDGMDKYIDPGIKNTLNIINQNRIIGVHAREMIAIPSKEQAYMVCFAVLDVLNRFACDAN